MFLLVIQVFFGLVKSIDSRRISFHVVYLETRARQGIELRGFKTHPFDWVK
jgi:hypothetical protein